MQFSWNLIELSAILGIFSLFCKKKMNSPFFSAKILNQIFASLENFLNINWAGLPFFHLFSPLQAAYLPGRRVNDITCIVLGIPLYIVAYSIVRLHTLFTLLSIQLKNIFFRNVTLSSCSHSPFLALAFCNFWTNPWRIFFNTFRSRSGKEKMFSSQ